MGQRGRLGVRGNKGKVVSCRGEGWWVERARERMFVVEREDLSCRGRRILAVEDRRMLAVERDVRCRGEGCRVY